MPNKANILAAIQIFDRLLAEDLDDEALIDKMEKRFMGWNVAEVITAMFVILMRRRDES
jgi:hypothetical protein